MFCFKDKNISLSKKIKDYTSGIYVMERDVLLMAIPNYFGHGEFFVEFIYKALKRDAKMCEIPFVHHADLVKRSKTASNLFHFIHLGFHYLSVIFHAGNRKN